MKKLNPALRQFFRNLLRRRSNISENCDYAPQIGKFPPFPCGAADIIISNSEWICSFIFILWPNAQSWITQRRYFLCLFLGHGIRAFLYFHTRGRCKSRYSYPELGEMPRQMGYLKFRFPDSGDARPILLTNLGCGGTICIRLELPGIIWRHKSKPPTF